MRHGLYALFGFISLVVVMVFCAVGFVGLTIFVAYCGVGAFAVFPPLGVLAVTAV